MHRYEISPTIAGVLRTGLTFGGNFRRGAGWHLDTAASRARHASPPDRMMAMEDVAQTYLMLARQPRYTWAFEMDLRLMGESF